jgi:hypothetical protein
MRSMLTSLLAVLALGYGAIGLLVWVMQERLVYFPLRELSATPRSYGLDYDEVELRTDDGVALHGWFVPVPAARATVLFLHGNGGNISHRVEKLAIFNRLGLSVLIVDYRGYGKSAGKPDEEGTYRDARAAWNHLTQARKIPATAIIVCGESLGGAVATQLATEHTPRALIIESSFTSVPDLGAEIYPWLPVRFLSRIRYDSRAAIARVQAPVLVIHSRADDIIPFHHGEALFAAANEPKQLLEIRGDHNAGFLTSGAHYAEGIDAFLRGLPKGE